MRKRRFVINAAAVGLIAAITVALAVRLAAKRHAELVNCGNQMHSILFVATVLWPEEHDGHLPLDFLSMSNELGTTKILVCPADHTRQPAANWSSFSPDHCSYELVTPGARKTETNSIFLRCKLHGYTGYTNGRLLDASGRWIQPRRLW